MAFVTVLAVVNIEEMFKLAVDSMMLAVELTKLIASEVKFCVVLSISESFFASTKHVGADSLGLASGHIAMNGSPYGFSVALSTTVGHQCLM